MTRPKAKWKVAYEAAVAAMDGATLLEETLPNRVTKDNPEWADSNDFYRDRVTTDELTRRLTAIGFLPPVNQPPNP